MDELNKIDNFICRSLTDLLFQMIPEYQKIYELENSTIIFSNGVYLFMNEFTLFLSNEIEKDSTSVIVKKAFTFINKVGESNNLEVLNILKIGILEILYTNKNIDRKLVYGFLNIKLQKYFNEFSENYY